MNTGDKEHMHEYKKEKSYGQHADLGGCTGDCRGHILWA